MRKPVVLLLICAFACGVGFLFFEKKDKGDDPASTTDPGGRVNGQLRGAADDSRVQRIVVREISSDEIATVKDANSAGDLYEQLSFQLMAELEKLREETDPRKIRRNLAPIANQFYLLQRAGGVSGLVLSDFRHLSQDQMPRVETLIALWNENQVLAREADRVFSRVDALDSEHLPFLLRRAINESQLND